MCLSTFTDEPLNDETLVEEKIDMEKWEKRRRNTLVGFCFIAFALGSEYSTTFATLWLYLNDLVRADNPVVHYSLISSAFYMSGIIFSLLVSRLVDRHRTVRKAVIICCLVTIVGDIIYVFHYSPLLPLLGKVLSGVDGALRPLIGGEIARCYDDQDSSSALAVVGMSYSIGFFTGPAISLAFMSLDVKVYSLHITRLNFPGLLGAVFFSIVVILSYFLINDVSKEYDPKQAKRLGCEVDVTLKPDADKSSDISALYACYELEDVKEEYKYGKQTRVIPSSKNISDFDINSNDVLLTRTDTLTSSLKSKSESCYSDEPKSFSSVIRSLFSHVDIWILLLCSFFYMFCVVSLDMWTTMVVVDLLQWSIKEVNGMLIGNGIALMFVLLFLWRWPLSQKKLVWFTLLAMVSMVICDLCFIVMKVYNKNQALNITLAAVYCLALSLCPVLEEMSFVCCLSKMVPSSSQNFAESVRQVFTRFGALAALLSSAFLFPWIQVVCLCTITVCGCTIIAFIVRRKQFMNLELKF